MYQYEVFRRIRNVNSTYINEKYGFSIKAIFVLSVKNMSQNLND